MKDRIVAFLAAGLTPVKITEIVGCSEAYISEVRASPDYAEKIIEAQKKIKQTAHQEKMEEGYMRLEDKVIKALEDNIPFAEFGELANVMDKLIRRKQTHAPTGSIVYDNRSINNVVMLSLPKAAAPDLVLNAQREVVSVNGKALAPMPSSGVRKLFASLKDKKNGATDAVIVQEQKKLPEPSTQPSTPLRKHVMLDEDDETRV